MLTKKGKKLHSKGKMLPFSEREIPDAIGYAGAVADALRAEVARSGLTAKMLMRWTSASERTVKGWLSGQRGPSGEHLIALMARMDGVMVAVLAMAGREGVTASTQLSEVRQHIRAALVVLDGEPGH